MGGPSPTVPSLQHADIERGRDLPGMSVPAPARRRGRRGRRTPVMNRIAGERIRDLFALAEAESRPPGSPLSDRYVQLARKVGARYNVRLPPEFADLYCRGCSTFWIEGRTVRTRLRAGHRTRTCLKCGRVRRFATTAPRRKGPSALPGPGPTDRADGAVLVDDAPEEEGVEDLGDDVE